MTLKNRLSKLEKTKRGIIAEADCIFQLEPEDEKRVKRVVELDSKAPKRNVSEPNS